MIRRVLLMLALAIPAPLHAADVLRVATWEAGLSRDGAGVLLRDLREGTPEIDAAVAVIRAVRPDILLLTRFDHDLHGLALAAVVSRLAAGPDGIDYPFSFQAPVNAGEPSRLDLDGDGSVAGRDDAFGWGAYPGHGGMALVSRLPLDAGAARSFRMLPWEALPGAIPPVHADGSAWPDSERRAAMRLSSRSHWDVPAILPGGGRLHLLASNPTPPLFDGPEGRNRRRNHDEIAFWIAYLDGVAFRDDAGVSAARSGAPVVVLGNLNVDPHDGAGMREGVARLLEHPALRDPRPASTGASEAAAGQGGSNDGHRGPPALDTVDWRDDGGPGNLRVDYVLPDAGLDVADAGVVWPAPGAALAGEAEAASAHRLVWVDLVLP